jgi:hypothetical protein
MAFSIINIIYVFSFIQYDDDDYDNNNNNNK